MADEPKNLAPAAEETAMAAEARGPRAKRRKSPIGEPLQQLIGSQLKAAYEEVVRQPVPDKFLELLSKLERKQDGEANQGQPS